MSALARVSPGEVPASWQAPAVGSKSITNRMLLLAGVARGRSRIRRPLLADDTLAMRDVLKRLGVGIEGKRDSMGVLTLTVDGLGGPPRGDADVYCGMGATVGRFLVPMVASGEGRFDLDAHPQLRRRPLGGVLAALRAQGAEIDGDAFPLTIQAGGLRGGEVEVDGSVSSQFLSGLLMAAPFARADTTLRFDELVSHAYLDLTLDAMAAFGVTPERSEHALHVPTGGYRGADVTVEPDASTASYFLGAAAVTGSSVTLPGLDRRVTRQGDIELVALLERMGCVVRDGGSLELSGPPPGGGGPPPLHGIDADMSTSSDVFMTLACVAVFADSPTTITGIGHARVKETDRIAACAENLRRLGIVVEEGDDLLRVVPGEPRADVRLPTYEDHRVAMAFSVIGTRVPVLLEEPGVVAKTFPEFFRFWHVTGANVELLEDGGGQPCAPGTEAGA